MFTPILIKDTDYIPHKKNINNNDEKHLGEINITISPHNNVTDFVSFPAMHQFNYKNVIPFLYVMKNRVRYPFINTAA